MSKHDDATVARVVTWVDGKPTFGPQAAAPPIRVPTNQAAPTTPPTATLAPKATSARHQPEREAPQAPTVVLDMSLPPSLSAAPRVAGSLDKQPARRASSRPGRTAHARTRFQRLSPAHAVAIQRLLACAIVATSLFAAFLFGRRTAVLASNPARPATAVAARAANVDEPELTAKTALEVAPDANGAQAATPSKPKLPAAANASGLRSAPSTPKPLPTPLDAATALAAGDYPRALELYSALATSSPHEPAFKVIATTLAAKLERRCNPLSPEDRCTP